MQLHRLALILPLLAACAEAPPPVVAPTPPVAKVAKAEPAAPRPVPPGHLRREDVMAVLSDGAPAFLARVDVKPVTTKDNKFVGWRIVDIDPQWAGGDVRPGDIVIRVNGTSLETPYTFFDVFQSLAIAKDVRIYVERDGHRIDVTYPIDDDPSAPPVPRASSVQPSPKPPGSGT